MNRSQSNVTLMLIAGDPQASSEMQACLAESFSEVFLADSVHAALDRLNRSEFSMVLCEWCLVENDDQPNTLVETMLKQPCPVIFHSTNQNAAVRFQRYKDRSFYCLRSSACAELVPFISNLAMKLHKRPRKPARPSRPKFVLPIDSSATIVATSNMYGLY